MDGREMGGKFQGKGGVKEMKSGRGKLTIRLPLGHMGSAASGHIVRGRKPK